MDARAGAILLPLWCITTMFFWGFAFFHLPETTPEWLVRAQAACFGTNETGLPDTYGWMLLTLAPLSMLVGMVIAMREEMLAGIRSLRSLYIGRAFITILSALFILETIWITTRIQAGVEIAYASYEIDSSEVFPENYPRGEAPAPEFNLIDQRGARVSLKDFSGKNVIMTFIFAHCRTVCPAMLKTATKAHLALPPDSTALLLVTLDPWRDTPSSLPSLAERWELKPLQKILSGEIEDVNAVINAYGVSAQRDEKTGDVIHPALYFLINREGKLVYTLNSPSTEWVISAANRLDGAD